MRVLITGVTGYIGSNLTRALLSDCEVFGLVREPLNLRYIADIKNQIQWLSYDGSYESMSAALATCRPDLIYHLAAYYTGGRGKEHTPALISSNVNMGAYLLDAMADCGCGALVYASTIMAHYRGADYCPLNLYAATKQAFSDLLAYYTDAGFLRAATLVISDTYGSGDERPKILNLVKRAALAGERMALSDGEQDYDVVHIDDVVRAFRMAGEQLLENLDWKNKTFQIAAEQPMTLRQTVELLCKINGLTVNADWGARPPAEREIRQVVRRYPALPGWTPQIPLEEGLRQLTGEAPN